MVFLVRWGLNHHSVLSSLVETCWTPALLYASKCIVWNKTMIKVFESAYSHTFFKLFNTFDMSTVAQCQYYMGILPIELKIIAHKLSFLHSINASENLLLRAMDPNNSELESVKVIIVSAMLVGIFPCGIISRTVCHNLFAWFTLFILLPKLFFLFLLYRIV